MVTGFHWSLASWLEIQRVNFKTARDKKPRGEADRISLTLCAAWEETRQHIPKGLPNEWKFADRYSIPSLVIVFTPRNGIGIENRASQWGEKANVRVFQYCI
jgi:hypothetical protein